MKAAVTGARLAQSTLEQIMPGLRLADVRLLTQASHVVEWAADATLCPLSAVGDGDEPAQRRGLRPSLTPAGRAGSTRLEALVELRKGEAEPLLRALPATVAGAGEAAGAQLVNVPVDVVRAHAEVAGDRLHVDEGHRQRDGWVTRLRPTDALELVEELGGRSEGVLRHEPASRVRAWEGAKRAARQHIHRRTQPGKADGSGVESLTARELQIARLVVDRRTNPQIAEALFLSPKTVETHMRNIFRKLDVSSRVEVARAVEQSDRTEQPT
jgi:DNA-binding CsgD family transcriptional regulator